MVDTVNTLQGAKLYVAGVHADVTDTAAEYAALTWVEVKHVEDYGEIGDESGQVTFTSGSDGRTRRFKGPRDAGAVVIIAGKDARDPGQIALKAAEANKFKYDFKLELADAPDANDTNTIYYWYGQVFSQRDRLGTVDNVVRSVFTLGIDTKPIEVASTAVP